MPSTYSPSLRIELIGAGEQSGTWGTTTNTNLGTLLEQSIAGVQAITMIDANYTLTNYNGVSDEARKAVLVASGTNTAARDIIAPLVAKNYIIKNNTTGGFAINIRAATGASVSIPNGVTSAVYCDGTNFNLALTQTLVAAGTGITVGVVGATNTIGIDSTVATLTGTQTLTNKTLTSPTLTTPALGTPTALVGTNITGTAASLTAGNATNATNATTASILNGTWNQMPAGTRVPFAQAAAPTGWTQDTSSNADNRMLRVVNTTGGGVAGSDSPIVNSTTMVAHSHTFTGTAHSHSINDPTHAHTDQGTLVIRGSPGGTTQFQDWYGSHSTSGAYTGITINSETATGSNSTTTGASWSPRYIDMIICSKT